jgi:Family of unknown function (DUF6516)
MNAEIVASERHQLGEFSFAEILIWRVPTPVRGSGHEYKYSLAYVVEQECVLRYDNEAGKGDHRHVGARQESYSFLSPAKLLADFWRDVDEWRPR